MKMKAFALFEKENAVCFSFDLCAGTSSLCLQLSWQEWQANCSITGMIMGV